jgi:hypothetical protein
MRPIHHVLVLLLPCIAFAQEEERVPTELFGVLLGGTYQLKEDDSHTLPVAEVKGLIRYEGLVHVYFEPLQQNPMFPYVEYPDKNNDHLVTSYRLQLLPVVTDDIDSLEEHEAVTEFRVVLIEWSTFAEWKEADSDDYAWAIDLCESIAADLALKPDVRDFLQDNWHICTFAGPEREIEVSQGRFEGYPIEGPERELEIASQLGRSITLANRNAQAEGLLLHLHGE